MLKEESRLTVYLSAEQCSCVIRRRRKYGDWCLLEKRYVSSRPNRLNDPEYEFVYTG